MKYVRKIERTKDGIIINDKYEITEDGVVYYAPDYIGKKEDFPQWVLDIAEDMKKGGN